MRSLSFACFVAASAVAGGCRTRDSTPPEHSVREEGAPPAESAAPPATAGVVFVPAPSDEPVEPVVRRALASALVEKRTLVVYVGATWCEPCRRFHRAAERGDLDRLLPPLTLLEFDLDRDGERLASGGYVTKYIPLFALPRPDGSASGRQVEGAIKGDGAVEFIMPRLRALLAP